MRGRMADALVGAEAAKSAVRRAGDDALRARRKHRLTVQGGRLWMLLVKSRHRRADAAVKRYLAAEEEPGDGERGVHSAASTRMLQPAKPHPGVQAQRFKAELRSKLREDTERARPPVAERERDDADAAQLSEASTSAAMEAEAPGSALPDWSASPLDEICESAWDAVTSKAHGCDDGSTAEGAPTSAVKPR